MHRQIFWCGTNSCLRPVTCLKWRGSIVNFSFSIRSVKERHSYITMLHLCVATAIIPDITLLVIVNAIPLTEISITNLPRRKGRQTRKADNLTAICEPIIYKMWEPRYVTSLWVSTACHRNGFTLFTFYFFSHLQLGENGKSSAW
jgi:hypothetical protein